MRNILAYATVHSSTGCDTVENMTTATASLRNSIAKIAQQSVHDAVRAEMMHLRASLLSSVSAKEQREIERKYGNPSRKGVRSIRVSFSNFLIRLVLIEV